MTDILSGMTITPAQCRAARALLAMSQVDLATKSEVSPRTVVHFENGARIPIAVTMNALQSALESAGVEFIEDGVKLRPKPAKPKRGG